MAGPHERRRAHPAHTAAHRALRGQARGARPSQPGQRLREAADRRKSADAVTAGALFRLQSEPAELHDAGAFGRGHGGRFFATGFPENHLS